MPAPARSRWSRIRLLATDVDGVLTDGRIVVSSDGTESKFFHVLDGYGIKLLLRAGVDVAWISGRPSSVTTRRAEELGVRTVYQGNEDKAAVLGRLLAERGLPREAVCYIGDDVNDLSALALAGIACTVPAAAPAVRRACAYVTRRAGGHGAVRELCDLILAARPRT